MAHCPGLASDTIELDPSCLSLRFDVNATRVDGTREFHQHLFDDLLRLIGSADDVLLIDMFLVNQFRGRLGGPVHRDTTGELVAALVAKKRQSPRTRIVFITDPINGVYDYGACPADLRPVADAGVNVLLTDLDALPDSNPLYSKPYYFLRPLLRRIPLLHRTCAENPFDPLAPRITGMQLLELLNFKANHRKVCVARDRAGEWRAIIFSANPHSASSAHGNAGLCFSGRAATVALASELRLVEDLTVRCPQLCFPGGSAADLAAWACELRMEFDGCVAWGNVRPSHAPTARLRHSHAVRFTYLTEARIGHAVDGMLDGLGTGDRVEVMMFYLSDPAVVRGLRGAALRGASVRLLLDPNKDAFGMPKNGVPNRPVAQGLIDVACRRQLDLGVRWVSTHGEQAHFKGLRVHNPASGRDDLLVGTANFTRRNLRGQNLESAVLLSDAGPVTAEWSEVFEQIWGNRDALVYSDDFDSNAVRGLGGVLKRALTALGNATGFCTY